MEEEKEIIIDMSKENAKLKEWLEITPYFDTYMKKNKKKLKLKIRKGIPDSLRGEIWMKISGTDKLKQGREKLYNDLISKIKENEVLKVPDEEIIIKDMYRTYPKNLMFMNRLGEGQRKLFRVLSCFSSYNKKVGYVQGMSFITAMFLTYESEENAFWLLQNYIKKLLFTRFILPRISRVKKEKPDVILITGDLVNNKKGEDTAIATTLISGLTDIAPVFFSYGNQEKDLEENNQVDVRKLFTEAGAVVMDQNYQEITVNGQDIRLGGVYGYCLPNRYSYENGWGDEAEYLKAFQDTDTYTVLMCHLPVSLNPVFFLAFTVKVAVF